jgi:hypothetical protein
MEPAPILNNNSDKKSPRKNYDIDNGFNLPTSQENNEVEVKVHVPQDNQNINQVYEKPSNVQEVPSNKQHIGSDINLTVKDCYKSTDQPMIVSNEKNNFVNNADNPTIKFDDNNNNNINNIPDLNAKNVGIEKTEKELSNIEENIHLDKIDINIKKNFMLKVYGILLFEFIFTFIFVFIGQINAIKEYFINHQTLALVLIFVFFGIYLFVFITYLCKPSLMKQVPQNYIFLLIVTICFTIFVFFISIVYDFQIVVSAMAFLFAICLSVFCIGLFGKIDLGYLAMAIIALLVCALTFGLLALIFRSNYLNMLYCFLVAIAYIFFLVYDTIMIRDHFDIDNYAFAVFILYMDIIRLFIFLLRIFGGGKKN